MTGEDCNLLPNDCNIIYRPCEPDNLNNRTRNPLSPLPSFRCTNYCTNGQWISDPIHNNHIDHHVSDRSGYLGACDGAHIVLYIVAQPQERIVIAFTLDALHDNKRDL